MKPLLILPPASARWRSLADLLGQQDAAIVRDAELRFSEGVAGATDAFALIVDGGLSIACASITRRNDVGVLGYVVTRPTHRGKGLAAELIESLIAWFDMTDGRWLYCATAGAAAGRLCDRYGFRVLHVLSRDGREDVFLQRAVDVMIPSPFEALRGDEKIRDVTRADWPLLVSLLQHRPGHDPRATPDESAIGAEEFALRLVDDQEQGKCKLLAAWHDGHITAFGTVAVDPLGDKTYAMLIPFGDAPPALRAALISEGEAKGYRTVEFPMEAVAKPGG
ncbi:MAG: GNAT family N-acetyltransferase [Phycisphaerales bacterium]|nr:GNAT family N-acetyltransferase [Phycisphaerales bacterium]